ncbi:MAG: membrane dipeptidase [Bacteroidota bacterium]
MYIDAHLDLAFNVVAHGRDLTRTVPGLRAAEAKAAQEVMVTLPELQGAGVGIVFGTIFTLRHHAKRPGARKPLTAKQKALMYRTPDEAHAKGVEQLDVYRRWEDDGWLRILRSQTELAAHEAAWAEGDRTTGLVLLMEGADPIRTPDELPWWVERGVRLVGPAWQRTRYSGGTFAPGPLTEIGRELVRAMTEAGVALDASHLAHDAVWDALDVLDASTNPAHVCASHSNAAALVPTDRHLTDAMLDALAERDAVVGVVLGNPFVKNGVARDDPEESVTLDDVRTQAAHLAGRLGWDRLGIGSDFDGGFGKQETPFGIERGADFAKLGDAVPEAARAGFLGGNWLRWLRQALPA